eukprot:5844525-Pleurochrysis_carterae.AAC.4
MIATDSDQYSTPSALNWECTHVETTFVAVMTSSVAAVWVTPGIASADGDLAEVGKLPLLFF